MSTTLAFDVYGTLVDPLGVATLLGDYLGERAPVFAQAWRDKQLEYSFRRALMRDYVDFPTCTRQALAYTDRRLQAGLAPAFQDALMAAYLDLPAYADALAALEPLRARGHRLFAFSNGHPTDLQQLLSHAGLASWLDGIVSVHPVESFKPDPAVYAHFLDSSGAAAGETWLVSGNPFDILGARRAGWNAAWVRRDPAAVFDPWGVEPTVTVGSLGELAAAIAAAAR